MTLIQIKAVCSVFINGVGLLMMGSVLLTWFPRFRWHPLGRLVFRITEPILQPIRRLLVPLRIGQGIGIDFSPVLVMAVVEIIYLGLMFLLKGMGIK